MKIREAVEVDFEEIWPIFHEIVSAGETYAYPQNTSKEEGKRLWLQLPRKTYVVEEDCKIIGTYYIKTNHAGAGDHVCNCGYMVSSKARGKGVATAMCEHSQKLALELGYKAMQFNFVASSNEDAVKLWGKLGFDIVGRLPKAFNHPRLFGISRGTRVDYGISTTLKQDRQILRTRYGEVAFPSEQKLMCNPVNS